MARARKAAVVETGPVDGPWELPEGWRWEPLGAVVTQSSGKLQPDAASDLPFVGLDSIEANSTTLGSTIPFACMRSTANSFGPGQVLYGRLRPYLNKVWLADRLGACSSEFIVLDPQPGLDARYLKWLLHHSGFVQFATHAVTGDRPRIDLARMSCYPVPVPPLDTQRRIVARIDELFTELDDGEAALARARGDLETYRKSLLKAAVTGELTADWRASNPPAETGEQLLQRILTERKARWEADPKNKRKRYKEPKAAHTSDLAELPPGWCWTTLEQLAWQSGYGTSAKCDYEAEGEPVLRIPNLRGGGVDVSDLKCARVQLDLAEGDYLTPGDLLIVRTNGSRELIGRAGIVEQSFAERTHFASYLIRFRIGGSSELHHWIRLFTDSALFRSKVLGSIGSSAGQYNLSLSKLNEFPVAVPPQGEVTAVLHAVQDGELALDEYLPNAQLRQSILTAAFRGELVQ